MAAKKGMRRFGSIRKLPSGRFQASYIDPTGVRQTAPTTYLTRAEAGDWLTVKEAEIVRGEWTDPDIGREPFGPYAERWINQRDLRPRTADLYRWLYGRYLAKGFGIVDLVKITPAMIRQWRRDLLDGRHRPSCSSQCSDRAHLPVSPTMVAKAYRLMRAVLMTAVDDELIKRNPCRISGAGTERPDERPVLSLEQVYALADLMPARQRMLIIVATFASLRYGEVTALERRDVDFQRGTVRVRQAFTEVRGQGMVLGPPKSRAGLRTVSIPSAILPELEEHMKRYTGLSRDALVFTGPKGAAIRRGNFNPLVDWQKAVTTIGAEGMHFHDLRHTGNTLAASSANSTKDLMARMGHDSMNAAIIYQHATAQADKAIAEGLDARLRAARPSVEPTEEDPDDGAAGALVGAG
ncbi:integrase [Kribbella orskensis]|uniref:Integrase n=1 Tax=Kribbella orskensis TaxID=2512216 RepID=A0ABY2BQS6_9ACTN|nr:MULTISPECIES: site-specific integrase [Kribbella]TCN25893.1 integrase [Kribbella sp. VKM Ac-2500]TCO27976.1 integrase [Kribbella orskensis]